MKEQRHASFALPKPFPELMEESGFQPLDLLFDVPARLTALPPLHGDPFDRILVAQALHHGMAIVTSDRAIAAYEVPVLW